MNLPAGHDHVYVGGLALVGGWWSECECGWISATYRTEKAATAAHEQHAAETEARQ